ncbi:hypothetical protein [Synechococcus sp. A15-28]|uniref:hypothetical protein n=1 Tax=Synechococcus sp. A15-28 TaxID=1050638 RepID=UPI001646E5D5|nr:hypothetical protein [Synechococcus sp. A15-28]QNI43348.1 hypothetical protein SynA1528_02343 [Synechococcus sp. A15-28]
MATRLITPSQLSLFSISPVIGAWWEELQAQNLFEGSKPAVSELDQQLVAEYEARGDWLPTPQPAKASANRRQAKAPTRCG